MIEINEEPIEYGIIPNNMSANKLVERVIPFKRTMVSEADTKLKRKKISRDSVRNILIARMPIAHSSSWTESYSCWA